MLFDTCMKKIKSDVLDKSPPFNWVSFAVVEEQNKDSKKSMEDFTIADINLTGNNRFGLFVILDGHGGQEVALYTKQNYPIILKKKLLQVSNKYTIPMALQDSIKKISKSLSEKSEFMSGSTFCGVLIDKVHKDYYTINVGDSRAFKAFPSSEGDTDLTFKLEPLTIEHKLTNQNEKDRILKFHHLIQNRLGGQILVTRALGDFGFAEYGLSDEPDINGFKLTNERFILIGSDGVWDFLELDEVIKCLKINETKGTSIIGQEIVKAAKMASIDNISLIVISIKQEKGN